MTKQTDEQFVKCVEEWRKTPEVGLSTAERVVMPTAVTNEMQIAAVRKAVELELLPKWASEEAYLKNYSMIKDIVQAALDAA